jgi:tRNA(Ile)-lysidine synthase
MHVLRGSGLLGMQGFLPKKQLGIYSIIRPFYQISRREIMDFVRAKKIPFRKDPTNRDVRFYRNRIRGKLIPLLQSQYQQNITTILASLAENTAIDYDFLRQQAEGAFNKVVSGKSSNRRIQLKIKALQNTHPALQRMIVRLGIERLQGDLRGLSFVHWEAINQLIHTLPDGSSIHLPWDLRVQKIKVNLVLSRIKT